MQAIIKCLDETLAEAALNYSDIDIVCCTGGTARLTALQDALALRIDRRKLQQHLPFHAVINGLAERVVRQLNHPDSY